MSRAHRPGPFRRWTGRLAHRWRHDDPTPEQRRRHPSSSVVLATDPPALADPAALDQLLLHAATQRLPVGSPDPG
jgi:hypothetical protein